MTPTRNASSSAARLPVRTYHCRFCSHLLLASTRDISRLPRRKDPAQDHAFILPLPRRRVQPDEKDDLDENEDEPDGQNGLDEEDERDSSDSPSPATSPSAAGQAAQSQHETPEQEEDAGADAAAEQEHYSILLSTTIPDRRDLMIRRADGFEKRQLLRCGRCRVVVGYFLDKVHFAAAVPAAVPAADPAHDDEDDPEVVYLLPGALVETGSLADEERIKAADGDWASWLKQ